MMSEVCPKCQCYITPPNPWYSVVPPKMCQCSSWTKSMDEELLKRFQQRAEEDWARLHEAFKDMKDMQEKQLKMLEIIEENMPKKRSINIGPL